MNKVLGWGVGKAVLVVPIRYIKLTCNTLLELIDLVGSSIVYNWANFRHRRPTFKLKLSLSIVFIVLAITVDSVLNCSLVAYNRFSLIYNKVNNS